MAITRECVPCEQCEHNLLEGISITINNRSMTARGQVEGGKIEMEIFELDEGNYIHADDIAIYCPDCGAYETDIGEGPYDIIWSMYRNGATLEEALAGWLEEEPTG